MLERLDLPPGLDGRVVRHLAGDVRPAPHRHAELEVNLVLRGTATYLLGDRRYELTPGTLTWLFPGQEHVLVDRSADHELWWAVFTPRLVARVATAPHLAPLLAHDPEGEFSRHIGATRVRRLRTLLEEVSRAESRDPVLANAGLAYLLTVAWRALLDSSDAVDGVGLHPAVRAAARLLAEDPNLDGGLAGLGRRVGLSPTHLSRLFADQVGVPLTRYRNRQRLRRFVAGYGDGTRTTVTAAATTAGFGSYAQFYRVHRQETGRSPATLREP